MNKSDGCLKFLSVTTQWGNVNISYGASTTISHDFQAIIELSKGDFTYSGKADGHITEERALRKACDALIANLLGAALSISVNDLKCVILDRIGFLPQNSIVAF